MSVGSWGEDRGPYSVALVSVSARGRGKDRTNLGPALMKGQMSSLVMRRCTYTFSLISGGSTRNDLTMAADEAICGITDTSYDQTRLGNDYISTENLPDQNMGVAIASVHGSSTMQNKEHYQNTTVTFDIIVTHFGYCLCLSSRTNWCHT